MKRIPLVLLFAALIGSFGFSSLHAAVEDPAHNELRTLAKQVIEAITKADIDAVITHVHPNVVVTWQNAEVCRGADGLREFFNRMGRETFKGYKVPPTPDDLTVLYGGDTGVSFGYVVGAYSLFGQELEFKSRWTATLVKENGRWLLASYHVSLNALDNPLINSAKKSLVWIAVAAGVLGVFVGWLLGRRKRA
jgi:ketosteroid isomerase-like protein